MIYVVVILIILIVFLIYRSIQLINEIQKLNNLMQSEREYTLSVMQRMLEDMRDVDLRGAFESDDEVGAVFNKLKELITTSLEKM